MIKNLLKHKNYYNFNKNLDFKNNILIILCTFLLGLQELILFTSTR